MSNKISLPVIRRLPRYHRYVAGLRQNGVVTVSSSELALAMGSTTSQVRQDFNCFGGFGQQGIGYNIEVLFLELEKLLFSGPEIDTILIGTGKLGRAMLPFLTTEARGYRLVAAFDRDNGEIGQTLGGIKVRDVAQLAAFCREHKPKVAVLCIPPDGAKELTPLLLSLGIGGFWNFSHCDLPLDTHPDVLVENVHLSDSLMGLGYRLRNAPQK